jgi:hypothetical protein
MVLIIKRQNHDDCFVARMSDQGDPEGNPDYYRLIDFIDNMNLDNIIYRIRVYRLIIDELIIGNKWNINNGYDHTHVSNTLHDWLVIYFQQKGISKYFIEVNDDVFRPNYLN